MKKRLQKSLVALAILFLAFGFILPIYGISASDTLETGNIPKVIQQYIEAINTKDWDKYVGTYSPERQKSYTNFPSEQQKKDRTGILSVDSIQVYQAKKLPATHITEIEPYFKEIKTSLYDNIEYYYIGFEYKVYEESEFFYNGVRYELLAIGNLDGIDYIIGHENVYKLSRLGKYGYTFGSEAEQKAQNIVDKRKKGIIVNFNDEIIGSNTDVNIENNTETNANKKDNKVLDKPAGLDQETSNDSLNLKDGKKNNKELEDLEKASLGKDVAQTIQPLSWTSTPSTFKLYLTGSGTTVNIGFDDYAKQVLPNEWYPSWEDKSLQAGAIAIKTYAWYNATNPRKPATDYGAHLTDRWQNYQHFVEDSNQPSTDAAVDDVSGLFMRNSDGEVFDAQYRAGTQGDIGTAFGGELSQWGTQYIATNYPEYDVYTILSYYYSFSDKSEGYIQVGNY